ncbi:hypothetical protein [Streptomyces sp. NPDC059816]|uniref:hypothetical protein n=1 Tax=Streptomyces sp. NPDC059816 TaxID=3346960 RepID=UPI0036628D3B
MAHENVTRPAINEPIGTNRAHLSRDQPCLQSDLATNDTFAHAAHDHYTRQPPLHTAAPAGNGLSTGTELTLGLDSNASNAVLRPATGSARPCLGPRPAPTGAGPAA